MNAAWTEEQLASLPVKSGVRQRGVEMTRLETFCDASFAFAVTLLVIGGGSIPNSYQELVAALKGVPAFAASFTAIAAFWWSHRTWSRRYGLEDGPTTLISLAFVFVMLVYVYPLRMVFSAFASFASGGRLPTEFSMTDPRDMLGIFAIYGVGFAAQTGLLALLHLRVLKVGTELGLNEIERVRTRQEIAQNLVLGATGVASALWAVVLQVPWALFAGFLYTTLPVTMPLLAVKYARRVKALQRQGQGVAAGSPAPPTPAAAP
jgi:hypothetical protein